MQQRHLSVKSASTNKCGNPGVEPLHIFPAVVLLFLLLHVFVLYFLYFLSSLSETMTAATPPQRVPIPASSPATHATAYGEAMSSGCPGEAMYGHFWMSCSSSECATGLGRLTWRCAQRGMLRFLFVW